MSSICGGEREGSQNVMLTKAFGHKFACNRVEIPVIICGSIGEESHIRCYLKVLGWHDWGPLEHESPLHGSRTAGCPPSRFVTGVMILKLALFVRDLSLGRFIQLPIANGRLIEIGALALAP